MFTKRQAALLRRCAFAIASISTAGSNFVDARVGVGGEF
jgi:hypothetical protein